MLTKTTEVRGLCEPSVREIGLHLVAVASEFAEALATSPDNNEIFVGRSRDCQITVADASASRRHARFLFGQDGSATVEDLGSSNGTRVNGSPIAAHTLVTLGADDVVDIGATRLFMRSGPFFPGRRRLLSYDALQVMLDDACARAGKTERGPALIRWEIADLVPWPRIVGALCAAVPTPHVLAWYGPRQFMALLLEADAETAREVAVGGAEALAPLGRAVKHGIASSCADGTSAHALIERAGDALRNPVRETRATTWSCENPDMRQALRLAERAAQSSISVLITGKTGVGKDVLARRIHALSPRSSASMLSLNCGALSEALIESELFGHERGSFSGAVARKAGLLETADGGTVFLDEIGEMPPMVQVKLLRVLETKEFLPVGSVKPHTVDVRFVAATNRDLQAACAAGSFREDLYFRLAGIVIHIPPLQERRDEILWLVRHFVRLVCAGMGRHPEPRLTAAAEQRLLSHDWPGNIREVKNVVERAVVLCDGDEIDVEHLLTPQAGVPHAGAPQAGAPHAGVDRVADTLSAPRVEVEEAGERSRIIHLLTENGWNQSKTARLLGVSRRTLIHRLEKYAIPRPQKNGLPERPGGR